jgi:hypothetical protein
MDTHPTTPATAVWCRTCGILFALTAADVQFYTAKGWHLPLHCDLCRRLRRAARRQAEANVEARST